MILTVCSGLNISLLCTQDSILRRGETASCLQSEITPCPGLHSGALNDVWRLPLLTTFQHSKNPPWGHENSPNYGPSHYVYGSTQEALTPKWPSLPLSTPILSYPWLCSSPWLSPETLLQCPLGLEPDILKASNHLKSPLGLYCPS